MVHFEIMFNLIDLIYFKNNTYLVNNEEKMYVVGLSEWSAISASLGLEQRIEGALPICQ